MSGSVTKNLTSGDSTLRARMLSLNRWLIPQQHADIPRFTRENNVEALIDGQATFRAQHAAYAAASSEDRIFYTGWDILPELRLLGMRSGRATAFNTVLGAARARGADVRILLWFWNATLRHTPRTWERFPWARIFTDNKTRGPAGSPQPVGSHHQKTAIAQAGASFFGFAGGIDTTHDRWDTNVHRFPDPDGQYPPRAGQPWHDVHTRVEGPAAGDVETNFRHRWNDRHSNPADQVPVNPAPGATTGTHIVQTLRTFPHHATWAGFAWHYNFAPTGEFGHRLAYPLALGNARHLVYIEDQYMVGDEISRALATAMRRAPDLRVILLTAPAPDGPRPIQNLFNFHQNRFLARLRAVDPKRVEIYHIENAAGTGIYVHSKLCIIDDIWVVVGSCNTNRRGLTHDSELGFAIIDETVVNGRRRFANDLRVALWSEHLGLTSSQRHLIEDPVRGAAQWRRRSRPGGSIPPARIVRHVTPLGSNNQTIWDTVVDPDGSRP